MGGGDGVEVSSCMRACWLQVSVNKEACNDWWREAASGGLPEESDSLQTCNLASCDGGVLLLFIKVSRHLHRFMSISGMLIFVISDPE